MKNKGFTLIELLIVIVIIGIIAAFAIPALLRNRIAANEGSAIAAIDSYYKAQTTFSATRSTLTGGTFYWTYDIAGLYYLQQGGNPINDIQKEVADADYATTCTAPAGYTYTAGCPALASRSSRSGYYFAAVARYNGVALNNPTDSSRFGIVAAPETYDTTGNNVFIKLFRGESYKSDANAKNASDILTNAAWLDITYPVSGNNPEGKPWVSTAK